MAPHDAVDVPLRAEQISRLPLGSGVPLAGLDHWRATLPEPAAYFGSALGGDCTMCLKRTRDRDSHGYALWLEIEERCNLDCLFCYNPWRPEASSAEEAWPISATEWEELLDLLMSDIDVESVTLSGGEPLMYPGLVDVVTLLRRRGLPVAITTNGRSGTRARIAALADAGVQQISVPVHSHRPEVHDSLAGGSSWHAAIRTIALARELAVDVVLTAVLTGQNTAEADLDGLAGVVVALGVRKVVANCFHATGQGLLNEPELRISNEEFVDALDRLRQRLPDTAVTVGSPPPSLPSVGGRIGSVRRIAVSPRGELKFCNHSSAGLVNLRHAPREETVHVLRRISAGEHSDLLESINNCGCLGQTSSI
ncbi:radical SAM protein [Amycolatopsis sp. NPDC005003]